MKIILVPEGETAHSWCSENKKDVLEMMLENGSLFFKKARISSAIDFENIVKVFSNSLFLENGEHESYNPKGTVQTPVFYPENERLLWHSENTFNYVWPTKIFFACLQPPSSGGETVTLDNRKLIKAFPKAVLDKFRNEGVVYERNYIPNMALSYKKVLGINSDSELPEHCKLNDIQYSWSEKVLKTLSRRPAIVRHPVTREQCFISQLLHWHPRCLDPNIREYLVQLYGTELPRNVYFGDSTPIDDGLIDDLRIFSHEHEESTSWETGDFLFIDNILCSHGRRSYSGDRTILVSLTDPIAIDELEQEQVL